MQRASTVFLTIAAGGVAASAASAAVVSSFTFDSLSASYTATSATTGTFSAVAVDTATLRSVGSFNRTNSAVPAEFSAGFVSGPDVANVLLTMNIVRLNATTASATGMVVITDINGDVYRSPVSGIWSSNVTGAGFGGSMTNPVFDSTAGNGFIDGNTGTWSSNFGPGALSGALSLILTNPGATFFTSSYSGQALGATGQIVPGPAVLALAGVAGAMSGRRRRS
jgi:uncharacterized protein (TIGR03382 family)